MFSNISKITYIDATGTSVDIDDPSAEFGLYTMNENNMYPANKQDYADIRQQIADLFPNIGVISANSVGNLSTTNEGTRTILINGTAFYINP